MKNEKNKTSAGKKVAIGAGVTALAASLAGAYYLFGTKSGKKAQKEVKGWMKKAEKEILTKIENMKEVNEDVYNTVVSEVAEKYKALKEVDTSELETLSKHLKNQWKHVKRALTSHSKK